MNKLGRSVILFVIATSCHLKSELSPENAGHPIPTDSNISIPYSITNTRNAYKFDERNNNKRYLAESDGYDDGGNQIEHKRLSADGTVEEHIINIYDHGKVKETYRLEHSGSYGEALYKTYYDYRPDGKLSSTILFDFERRIVGQPRTDVLDESDFSKTKSWDQLNTESYRYDKKGNMIQKITTWKNSKEELNYVYDDRGNVIEEERVESGIRLKGVTSYYKDSTITKYTGYKYDGSIDTSYESINKKVYDKNKNLLDDSNISDAFDGALSNRWMYTYDSQNRVIKDEYITNLKTSIFTLYEYEKYNQPVSKIFTVNNH